MELATILLALSALVEEAVEHLKTQIASLRGNALHLLKYALGIGAAFALKLGVLTDLGFSIEILEEMSIASTIAIGLIAGTGSSTVNAIIERLLGRGNRWASDDGTALPIP